MNGPSNIVRLALNDIVIYVFMDKEIAVGKQSFCSDIRNIDINKFIVKTLDNLKNKYPEKKFTLYVSKYLSYDEIYNFNYKGSYINEMVKLCDSINKNQFTNTKADYMTFANSIYKNCKNIAQNINKKYLYIWDYRKFSLTDLTNIKDGLTLFKIELEKIYNYINVDIKEKYNNLFGQIILDKIIGEINDYIGIIVKKIDTEILELYRIIGKYKSVLMEKINNNDDSNNIMSTRYSYSYKNLMDIYDILLRLNYFMEDIEGYIMAYLNNIYLYGKILEEKTLNNILYLPELYGVNLIYILVKYFGYKITNGFYVKDIENNKENILKNTEFFIRQSSKFKDLEKIFVQMYNLNCINVESFPELFL